MFGKMKDMGMAKGVQIGLNQMIKEFGKITKLNLDSSKNSINMDILLEGENESINLTINKIEVIQYGNTPNLRISEISVSKSWMNIIVKKYLDGRVLPIPPEYQSQVSQFIK